MPANRIVKYHNMTSLPACHEDRNLPPALKPFPAGVMGFLAWTLALALPFIFYGANLLFLLLYTWPFFLALLPICVFTGVAVSVLLRGQLLWTFLVTVVIAAMLFWLLFSLLTGL